MPGSGSHPLSRTRGDLLRPGHATSKPWTWPARSGSARAAAEPLAGLGRCARDAVRTADAEAGLRQALAIFQRIGAAEAAGVSAELGARAGAPGPASTPLDRGHLA